MFVSHACDHGACGSGLSRFHARTRERNDRHATSVELRLEIEALVPNSRRHADALTEIREMQDTAQHTAVERPALVRIHRVADPEHTADVEHLDDVAGLDA